MSRRLIPLFVLSLAAAIPTLALADDHEGAYAVAGIGSQKLTSRFGEDSQSISRTGFTVGGGWRFSSNLAVEGNYYSMAGRRRVDQVGAFGSGALGASVLGIVPLAGGVDLYGRLGGSWVRQNFVAQPGTIFASDTNNRMALQYGIGVDVNLKENLFLRGEWTAWRVRGTRDAARLNGIAINPSQLSIGVGYRF